MKRILSTILTVALLVAMMPMNAFAAWPEGTTAPSLHLNTSYDSATQQVTAEVKMTGYSELVALQFDLLYDSSKLTLNGTPVLSTQLTNNQPEYTNPVAGKITFLWDDKDAGKNGGFAGSEHAVLTAVFDVVAGQIGKADFSLSGIDFVHKSGDDETTNSLGTNNSSQTLVAKITSTVALTGTLITPTKGVADTSTLTGTNVSVSVNWTPALVSEKFEANTEYKAVVTVIPETHYEFGTGANVTFEGLAFTQNGNQFVAEKTFSKTAAKTVTALSVTTQPTTKTYQDADIFNTSGMVVKAVFDDGTQDNAFTGYTVEYQRGAALKKDDTKVTLKADGATAEVTGLTVTGKKGTASLFAFTAPTLTYTAADQQAEVANAVTAHGTVETRGEVTYSYKKGNTNVAQIKDAGSYTLLASIAGGTEYDATVDIVVGTFTVAKKTLVESDFSVIDIADKAYTASKISPAVTAKQLVAGTDYDVTYGANKDAAINGGSITITGKGNCTGTVEKSFTITPIVLHGSDLEYTGTPLTKKYDGNTSCTLSKVGVKTGTLLGSDTLIVTGTAIYNTKDVATANKVVFAPSATTTGNYVLASSETLTIAATITATNTVTDTTPSNSAGAPISVIEGDGSFVQPTFMGVGIEAATGNIAYSYDGAVTYDEIKQKLATLPADSTATISYTFTGNGNYTGEKAGKLYIKIVGIKFTIDSVPVDSSNAVTLKGTPTYGDNWNDIVTIKNNIVVQVGETGDNATGTYKLDVTGRPAAGDNQEFRVLYSGTIGGKKYDNVVVCTGKVNVLPKSLGAADLEYTGTVTKVYDATTACALSSVAVKATSLVQGDTLTVTGTAVYNNAAVAVANKITFTADAITTGNYRLPTGQTLDVPATITKQPITVTMEDVASVDYDGTEKKPAVTVKNGENPLDASEYVLVYSNNINAGESAVVTTKASETGNYSFSEVSKLFTIKQVAYPGVKVDVSSAKYGNNGSFDFAVMGIPSGCAYGAVTVADADGVLAAAPVMNGNKLSYSLVNDTAKIGKSAIITVPVVSSINYTPFDVTITVTVLAKQVQDMFAFAQPTQVRAYADDDFTVTATGSAQDSTVTYKSSDTTVATVNNNGKVHLLNVGTVTITAAASETADYAKKEVSYTLTVNKSTLTVRPIGFTIYNGEQLPTLGVEYVGLKAGENGSAEAVLKSGALTMEVRNADDTDKLLNTKTNGTYKIIFNAKPIFDVSTHYDIVLGEGSLKIQSRPPVETPENTGGTGGTRFAITVSAGKGGYINTANTVDVGLGESAGFGIFANAGYRIADVKVDGKSVGAVSYYVFQNVTGNHTISATFVRNGTVIAQTGSNWNGAGVVTVTLISLVLLVGLSVNFRRRRKI